MKWPKARNKKNHAIKKIGIFSPDDFGLISVPVIQKTISISAKKRCTLTPLQCISDDFELRSPRHPEKRFSQEKVYLKTSIVARAILNTISAKKRYLVYLNSSISDDFEVNKSPRHSGKIFAKKRYALTPLFPTILGLISLPVIQEKFSPKKGIPQHLHFRRFGVNKSPRHSGTISAKKRYLVYLNSSTMYFRRFGVKEAPSYREAFQPKNGVPLPYSMRPR